MYDLIKTWLITTVTSGCSVLMRFKRTADDEHNDTSQNCVFGCDNYARKKKRNNAQQQRHVCQLGSRIFCTVTLYKSACND